MLYLVVQNDVIIDSFESLEDAKERLREEKNRDMLSSMVRSSLRRKFGKKASNVASHTYRILHVCNVEVSK